MWYSGNGDLLFCDNKNDAHDDSSYDEEDDKVSLTSTGTDNCHDEDLSSIRSMGDADINDNESLMTSSKVQANELLSNMTLSYYASLA